jgi:hypothetical protein
MEFLIISKLIKAIQIGTTTFSDARARQKYAYTVRPTRPVISHMLSS